MQFPIIFFLSVLFFLSPLPAFAGNPDSPAPPDDPASAVFTFEDLYYRLLDGTPGEKRTGAFSEPESGPGNYGHSINEIMSIAPAPDSGNAASPEDVPEGMIFWCVDPAEGRWGKQTGTMPNKGAMNITPGTSDQTIPAGYHNGSGTVAGDVNLVPENIAGGKTVFGVAGSATVATGDAAAGDVLTGKTFSKTGASGLTGTMPNKGAVSITPGTANQTIPAGYHNGSGSVAGDANLASGNIRSGASIFGVSGTVIQSSGDASAGDVLSGRTFSNAGSAGMSGTMTNNGAVNITPGTANQTIPQGYHNGSGTVAGDANLTSGNIVSGKTIFGVAGSAVASAYPSPVYTTGQTFTDNGDGTVTDNRTGLIWLKNANCTETVGGIIGGQNTWNNAMTFCNNLEAGKCGLTDGSAAGDWRLPHINELISLIDRATFNPALPSAHPFTGVQTNYYWSATTSAGNTTYAWDVSLVIGNVSSDSKTNTYYVWPVR